MTTHGTQNDLGEMLCSLMTLDYDAIAAYESAIERVSSDEIRARLRDFLSDHERHIVDLRPHASRCDHVVASGPDARHYLTAGKVMVAKMLGDHAILAALVGIEDDTNEAYAHALSHDNAPSEVLAVLQRNFMDERRHRRWLTKTLHPDHHDETIEDIEAQRSPDIETGWQAGLDTPPPM